MTRDADGFERNEFAFLRAKMPSDDWPKDSSGFPTLRGSVGELFSVPVIESPFVPPGQVYVMSGVNRDGYAVGAAYHKPLYVTDARSVKGHIERKANEIRRRWGMAEVDYAAEAAKESMRRMTDALIETRLALGVLGSQIRSAIGVVH